MNAPIEFLFLHEAVKEGYRNESEREFLTALQIESTKWTRFGLKDEDYYVSFNNDSTLMVAFDIIKHSKVARSLRVDFTGTSILMCDLGGGSNLFNSPLGATDHDVKVYREANYSPTDFARFAAKWLTDEFSKSR
jgi:hypothetical protein